MAVGPAAGGVAGVVDGSRLDDINAAMDNLADGIAVRQLITFDADVVSTAGRIPLSAVEGPPQRAALQGEQLLGDLPVGQQRVEPVTGAGEHMQLGGDPVAQQPLRVVERLVTQRVDVRAGDECPWQAAQLVTPGRGEFADASGCAEVVAATSAPRPGPSNAGVALNSVFDPVTRSSSTGWCSSWNTNLPATNRRAHAQAAAKAPPALLPATATRVAVDAQLRRVGGHPVQHGDRVVERGRVGMLGGQPVVHRHHRAVPAARQFDALPVVGIQIAEHECRLRGNRSRPAPGAVHHGRSRTRHHR